MRSAAPARAGAARTPAAPPRSPHAVPRRPPCRGAARRSARRHPSPPRAGGDDADAAPAAPAGDAKQQGSGSSNAGAPASNGYASSLADLWRNDFFFMDRRGRADAERALNGVAYGHELLVAAFGRGERPALQAELERMRGELEAARQQATVSELRLAHTAERLSELQRSVRGATAPAPASPQPAPPPLPAAPPAAPDARNYWYPVAHASALGSATLLPFDLFGSAWLLFRDAEGRAGALADSCAHRACPLSLGKNVRGRVQCPYHGWEYSRGGACDAMPSCDFLPGVAVRALPTVEQDGLLWVWPGEGTPAAALPRFGPPRGFTTVAAIALDVPTDAERVLQGLLEAAERRASGAAAGGAAAGAADDGIGAAATSSATSAAPGEGSEGALLAAAAARALRGAGGGAWGATLDSLEFEPPAAVLSTLTLGGPAPGADDVAWADAAAGGSVGGGGDGGDGGAARRVHLLVACLPSRRGRSRVLYRLSVNFSSLALATAPGARSLWQALAEDLLREQLATVELAQRSSDAAAGAAGGAGAHAARGGSSGVGARAREAYARWRASLPPRQ